MNRRTFFGALCAPFALAAAKLLPPRKGRIFDSPEEYFDWMGWTELVDLDETCWSADMSVWTFTEGEWETYSVPLEIHGSRVEMRSTGGIPDRQVRH